MFTLSGRFLEDGENLFQDFWSPFSISFICFSARYYLKKREPTSGRTRAGLRPGGLYKPLPAEPRSPSARAPPPNPSRRAAQPPPAVPRRHPLPRRSRTAAAAVLPDLPEVAAAVLGFREKTDRFYFKTLDLVFLF